MLLQIIDGSVSAGGHLILSHFDFEIHGKEKIAIVGRNGAGKTTLLRLLAGELALDRDDKRNGPGLVTSRKLTIGMLKQQPFAYPEWTVEKELMEACPCKDAFDRQRFSYEQEYDRLFTGFGFQKADKQKQLASFSGGEQTKIALIRLLLAKPDILLLDEPTNHLDEETIQWLEQYLKTYSQAVVTVSHDRYFLDQTADIIYELEGKKAFRYGGNYTRFRQEKRKQLALQQKAWEQYCQESSRLEAVIERFKHKPTKASFARAKKKQWERIEKANPPRKEEAHLFTGEISPFVPGGKWVVEAEHLQIGYDTPLLELSLRIRRGQKIGLLGPNGAGKTTFLKTIAGLLPALAGKWRMGNHISVGYFDQYSAQIQSDQTVIEHFSSLFPSLTDKEARGILGSYLFREREAARRISDLSGGEKARLTLAELLQNRPNFLILDEPTNHMDIPAKETLESAFRAYTGTILFVSHDRYFIRQVADSILIFKEGQAFYYPFDYEHYREKITKGTYAQAMGAQVLAEDQALISSLRAVPKAEHHRLREISTEEAYEEWKLRVAQEEIKVAENNFQEQKGRQEAMLKEWQESQEFWEEKPWNQAEEYRKLTSETQQTWLQWHECCLQWIELYVRYRQY